MAPSQSDSKPTVLLLDLYEWTDAYPAANPLRNVTAWFGRHLPVGDQVELRAVGASDDLLATAQDVAAVIISGSPRDAWGRCWNWRPSRPNTLWPGGSP